MTRFQMLKKLHKLMLVVLYSFIIHAHCVYRINRLLAPIYFWVASYPLFYAFFGLRIVQDRKFELKNNFLNFFLFPLFSLSLSFFKFLCFFHLLLSFVFFYILGHLSPKNINLILLLYLVMGTIKSIRSRVRK